MKVTTNIKYPEPVVVPPPVLESVTLNLSPRQAFLLMTFIGSTAPRTVVETINRGSELDCNKGTCFATNPPNPAPDSVKGTTDFNEVRENIVNLYYAISKGFEDAVGRGVK